MYEELPEPIAELMRKRCKAANRIADIRAVRALKGDLSRDQLISMFRGSLTSNEVRRILASVSYKPPRTFQGNETSVMVAWEEEMGFQGRDDVFRAYCGEIIADCKLESDDATEPRFCPSCKSWLRPCEFSVWKRKPRIELHVECKDCRAEEGRLLRELRRERRAAAEPTAART